MGHTNWKHEIWEINSLHENPLNPRFISKKQGEELDKSLRKFGQCESIVIQPDGTIIGGHQRYRLLKKLGKTHVSVSVPDDPLTPKEFEELTIRLNKNTGDWDFDALANDWDVDLLLESGFSPEELHLEIAEEEKPKKFSLNVQFQNEDDLADAERDIRAIVDKYHGAKCKVKKK